MNRLSIVCCTGLALILVGCGKEQQEAASAGSFFDLLETPVGDVDFPVGCNAEASPLVERGVALLHHMMYDEANFVFGMADDADPECAIAYWGQAMTIIHPLWPDTPSAAMFERGSALVEKSLSLFGRSDRENGYLETTRAYFEGGEELTERQRLARFKTAWKAVSASNPDDLEARAFYSLALRATASPGDDELLLQREAGSIAESVLAENPNHPGAHHYIIHAYDYPKLAEMALDAADNYGKITPRVPHATHMMTHIYTRLGQWRKAVKWNTISADTAWALCLETGEINLHYTHALDYLAYAYLQTGEDDAVLNILQTADELQPPYGETNRHASAYAFAALPARYALERRDWNTAVQLKPRMPSSFPWEKVHDPYVAITHFARAIGYARLGRAEEANDDIEALQSLRFEIASASPYWAQQVHIQEAAARAWQSYARNDKDVALQQMQEAAMMEASTEKHALTPGEILPAAELYGDMLLEVERYEEALEAYRTALRRSPRRYNSLYGAGKAAMGAGDEETAQDYFAELILMAGDSKKPRTSLDEARAYSQAR